MDRDEAAIMAREQELLEWFTRACNPVDKVIDGLDIGWGGVQRWATARLPALGTGPHLDVACGYATFLAELGWRFPNTRLFGLNIDFKGPHRLAHSLLETAGVPVELVQGDAQRLPFADGTFPSLSCFLGLQDIQIGFGERGVQESLGEMARVLRPDGLLVLLDEFRRIQLESGLAGLPLEIVSREERELDARWPRNVAERAIELYARGWAAQARLADRAAQEQARREAQARMTQEMEIQFARQGYFVPFGPIGMIMARRTGS